MRKLLLFALAVMIGFTACNKNDAQLTDVEFSILETDFKERQEVPVCSDLSMDYAVFELSGTEYTSPLFVVDGELLTQAIKLTAGMHTLSSFYIYHDMLPLGVGPEDSLVRAAPLPQSEYWDLMVHPLTVEFEVEAFKKHKNYIDVLCFEPLFYAEFGFKWWSANLVKIERQCFFGDICTGKLLDFEGSLYEEQENGLQPDMPAIFEIDVYKGEELIRTFSNEEYLGEGQCLEVYWANDEDLEEEFTFDLKVLLPQGEGFAYQLIESWTFLDDNCPEAGEDGVVDFVLGGCQIGDSDYQFPYWMDLPPEPFYVEFSSQNAPSPLGFYTDATFSEIPAGYDLTNITYGSFCGDLDAYLTDGYYTAVNSLGVLPDGFVITPLQAQRMNYFFNKLPVLCTGLGAFTYASPVNYWSPIQEVVWHIIESEPLVHPLAILMIADVMANGEGFVPLPAGWAAIYLWAGDEVQTTMLYVDP